MPCYYFETPEERAAANLENEKRKQAKLEGLEYQERSLKKEVTKLRKTRNQLTKFLCEAMTAIESGDVEDLVSEELLEWHKDHKMRDALRISKKK
jgi:hypothetical protein